MRGSIHLILALIIEVVLLILVILVLLVGVLGVFLPILPGILFFGIAAALYSLLVRSRHGVITPKVHTQVIKGREKIYHIKLIQKFMPIFKKLKKRKEEKAKEAILKHGLVLFGLNIALILAFTFGFIGLSLIAKMMKLSGMMLALVPLGSIFIFAAVSAVLWYRFGQILGKHFAQKRVVNSALVVLISVLPLLVFALLLSSVVNSELVAVLFLGTLLMSILAAVFELIIVSIGAITIVD